MGISRKQHPDHAAFVEALREAFGNDPADAANYPRVTKHEIYQDDAPDETPHNPA